MSLKQAFTIFDTRRVVRLLCITWFITKLICYKLWFADRLFPVIPVNDLLLGLPLWTHSFLFVVSLCAMLSLVFFPNKKTALILLLAELLSCMLDQNRWQPWEYQFIFMLAAYTFINEEKSVRSYWQLIIAGLFFFSGVSKLNNGFIHDIWNNLVLRRWLDISTINSWTSRAGYALPLMEMTAGIGLLIGKTRKLSIWGLTTMHIIILCMLGPAGLNMNIVIWPWNILMPLLLFSIFYQQSLEYKQAILYKPFAWFVLLCWWILPWLQLAGYWDKYLSAVLYSGGVEQLYICTDDPVAKKEMAGYMDKEFKVVPCSPVLSAYKWGMMEMNTAPYPEPRIYKKIIQAWNKHYPHFENRYYLYKPGFTYMVKQLLTDTYK